MQETAYQRSGIAYMIAKRVNHLQVQKAAAFLLGEHAGFITGTDLLIDGGVIASIRTGQQETALQRFYYSISEFSTN